MDISNFDVLSKNFSFQINGKSSFGSNLGGLLSIILLFSFLSSSIYFGLDMFQRKNPKFYFETEHTDHDNYFDFTENNSKMLFAYELNDRDQKCKIFI